MLQAPAAVAQPADHESGLMIFMSLGGPGTRRIGAATDKLRR
jgi:hypothetical protein